MTAGGLPILTYHAIDASGAVTSTDPARFAETLDALLEAGFRAVDLGDWIAAGRPAGRRRASPWPSTTACGRSSGSPTGWPAWRSRRRSSSSPTGSGSTTPGPASPAASPGPASSAGRTSKSLARLGFRFGSHGRSHARLDRLALERSGGRTDPLARPDRADDRLGLARCSPILTGLPSPGSGRPPLDGLRRGLRHPAGLRDGGRRPLRHRPDRRLLPPLPAGPRPPDRGPVARPAGGPPGLAGGPVGRWHRSGSCAFEGRSDLRDARRARSRRDGSAHGRVAGGAPWNRDGRRSGRSTTAGLPGVPGVAGRAVVPRVRAGRSRRSRACRTSGSRRTGSSTWRASGPRPSGWPRIAPGVDLEGLAEAYYAMTPDVEPRRRGFYLGHILGAEARGSALAALLPRAGRDPRGRLRDRRAPGGGGRLGGWPSRGPTSRSGGWSSPADGSTTGGSRSPWSRPRPIGCRIRMRASTRWSPTASWSTSTTPPAAVREWARVLRPGGTLLAWSPNRYALTVDPHVRLWGLGWLPRGLDAGLCPVAAGRRLAPALPLARRGPADGLARPGFESIEVEPPAIPEGWARSRPASAARLIAAYDVGPAIEGLCGRCSAAFGPLWQLRATRRGAADGVERGPRAATLAPLALREGGRTAPSTRWPSCSPPSCSPAWSASG